MPKEKMKSRPKKGASIELDIHDLAFGARGVARTDDFVWFVEKGIPGQKVRARVIQVKKKYGEAYVEDVLEPSPYQQDPPCPYFGVCGGCRLQHLSYDVQVEAKTRQVKEILERIGGLNGTVVQATLPSEDIYHYRNKMEFSFSDKRWLTENDPHEKPTDFALGLHVPGRYDKVLDIDACLLQSETCNRVFKTVKELVLQTDLPAYSTKTNTGFYRFLVIREGKNTGDLMLNFVTSGQAGEEGEKAIGWIVHKMFWRHPEVTTVIHSITDRKAQVATADTERLVLGPEKLTEKVGNRTFEISANAFFQTNTRQAQRLFNTIVELADLHGGEVVYDLYCGTGAIGIMLADRVKKVVGIEAIESAVKDAERNAELNSLSNMEFVLADMKDAMKDVEFLEGNFGLPDVVILDPPRAGTHPKTIHRLVDLMAPKIIYVSCNPAILARDLEILCESIYSLETVQPVDMFPHTGHIEVVATLVKNHQS